jgi:four helix bundle protein
MMKRLVKSHCDLDVYQRAFKAAMEVFDLSHQFPKDEVYSLTNQIRRSSRSVCANLAEAWRKRRYPAAFQSKIADADAEAGETQVWLEFSVKCGYLSREKAANLYRAYDGILATLVGMTNHPDSWTLPGKAKTATRSKSS